VGRLWRCAVGPEFIPGDLHRHVIIYLLSTEAVTSPYCEAKFTEAHRLRKRIVTVQVRNRTKIPPEFSARLLCESPPVSGSVEPRHNLQSITLAGLHLFERQLFDAR
jgi:hypothetical protein